MEQGLILSRNSLDQSQQVESVLQQVQTTIDEVNVLSSHINAGTSVTEQINQQMATIADQISEVNA